MSLDLTSRKLSALNGLVRLKRSEHPLTDQGLHQGADASGAKAGAKFQSRELGVHGVGVNIRLPGGSEKTQIPKPNQPLARGDNGAATADVAPPVLAPAQAAAQPDRPGVRRQAGSPADHAVVGEVTGVDPRAVLLGGDEVGSLQKALEHVAGHHGRGDVPGDGVFAQQQPGIGKRLQGGGAPHLAMALVLTAGEAPWTDHCHRSAPQQGCRARRPCGGSAELNPAGQGGQEQQKLLAVAPPLAE